MAQRQRQSRPGPATKHRDYRPRAKSLESATFRPPTTAPCQERQEHLAEPAAQRPTPAPGVRSASAGPTSRDPHRQPRSQPDRDTDLSQPPQPEGGADHQDLQDRGGGGMKPAGQFRIVDPMENQHRKRWRCTGPKDERHVHHGKAVGENREDRQPEFGDRALEV